MSEFKNEFSWSISRDTLFRRCPRAYFYNHYGFWGGWEPDSPPEVRELYIMKNLETIPMWCGRIVHEVLGSVVGAIRRGSKWPIHEAIRMAEHRAQRDFEDSQTAAYRLWPKRLCGLQEHYYGVPIGDAALEGAVVTMEGCIREFYNTPTYNKLLDLGPQRILEHEELQSMTVSGHKVWLKADLVVRLKDAGVMVVDWKTGRSSGKAETELQLAVYGIYAVRTYDASPDEVFGVEVNLRTGEEQSYPLDAHTLEGTRRYIEDSANRMQALLHSREENRAFIRDFPKVDNSLVCHDCRFRRECNRN